MILEPPEGFEPASREEMLVDAAAAGDLTVRDVPEQQMEERVLRLLRDRRLPLPAHELLALESMQASLELRPFGAAVQGGDGTGPEDLADHGCVLDDALFLGRQRVETRPDDPLDRLGHLRDRAVSALGQHLRVLLGVERVSTCPEHELRLLVGLEQRASEQQPDQSRRVVVRERR